MIMTQHEEQMNLPITPPSVLSGSREAMEPLYEQLLQHTFPDSHSAVQFCRHACAEFGFTVKQEASANRNIYVYCSREGLPDSQRKPKSAPQRKRPSKRCDCRWRVVLTENNQGLWEFRKASSPTAYEHNHEMMDPKEMVKTWPIEVNHLIIELARQKMQTHEIRDVVKQRFPNITWNERRFYNRLTEERKRIKQRDIIDRVQRMLFLTAKMCSLVAANDEWSMNVENELNRLYDNYIHLNRFNPDTTPLVDFNMDQITLDLDQFLKLPSNYQLQQHRNSFSSSTSMDDDDNHSSSSMIKMEIDDNNSIHTSASSTNNSQSNINPISSTTTTIAAIPTTHSNKKRKSVLLDDIPTATNATSPPPPSSLQLPPPPTITSIPAPKGSHTVYIPAYTLFVRSHNTRSSTSDTSTSSSTSSSALHHRKSFQNDMTSPNSLMDISSPHPQQNMSFNNPSFYSLASPTSPSSSSSITSSTFPHHSHRPSSLSTSPPNSNHSHHHHHHHHHHPMMHPTSTSPSSATHFQSSSSPPSSSDHQSFYMKPPYHQQPPPPPPPAHHTSITHPHSFNNMPLQQAAQIYSMQSFSNYPPNQPSTNSVNNPNNSNNNSNNTNNTNNNSNNNNNNNNNNNHPNDMNFSFDQSSLISNPTSPSSSSSHHHHDSAHPQQQSHQRHPSDMYRSMMDFNMNQHHHSPSPSSTSSIHHQRSSNDLNNNNQNNNNDLYMYSTNNGSSNNNNNNNNNPTESQYRPSSLPPPPPPTTTTTSTNNTSQRLQNNHPDMMNRIMMDQASMT